MSVKRVRAPFSVFARKYAYLAFVAAVAAALYSVIFALLADGAVKNFAQVARLNATSATEIVFSEKPAGEECFYNLNGNFYAFTAGGKKLNCDLIMERGGEDYRDNAFFYRGGLNGRACAVSANLAFAYSVKTGDEIFIEDISFTVGKILPAQSGVDPEYPHDGVIIFAYDGGLAAKIKQAAFVSFFADGAFGYKYSVRVSDLKNAACVELTWRAAVAAAGVAAVCVLCEVLLFTRRRKDYAIKKSLGMNALPLFLTVAGDTLFKYFLPLVLVSAAFYGVFAGYGTVYFIVAAFCFGAGLVVSAAVSAAGFLRLGK